MPSGLTISPTRGTAGYVRSSGFHETVIGKPGPEGPAGGPLLSKRIITVNGAGFGTVPRIVVTGALIGRYSEDGAGRSLYGLVYSDALLRTVRGELSGALRQFGEVPLAVKLASALDDVSAPIFSTGIVPLSTSIRSVEEALCRCILRAERQADLSIVIQPAIGSYFDAGPYGRLYGPLVSGTATAGAVMETTVCAGYDIGSVMPLSVPEGDGRPLKEMLQHARRSNFIQVIEGRERSANLTTLSYVPSGPLCEEPLGWLFSRLKRLHQFAGTELEVDWAVAGGEGRPAPAVLRIAEKNGEKDPAAVIQGKTQHGIGKRECSGLVYEYSMRPDSVRAIDAARRDYVFVCRATNIINCGVTPQDIPNAAAVVVIVDVPEKVHKTWEFCRGAGAAGKIVIHAESNTLDDSRLGATDVSIGGYMISGRSFVVDAAKGSVSVV
ncbi:MAG: hypothetical protein AB1324_07075 [Candidatus Micrarchaeota archaeon]